MASIYPTVCGKQITAQDCSDILDTGLMGGATGYWAEGRRLQTNGEESMIESVMLRPHRREGKPFPDGDPRNDWQTITPQRIASTLADIANSNKAPTWLRVRLASLIANDDLGGADAEEADCILQLTMFNEIVFG